MVNKLNYHNKDDMWIVSGFDEAVLKKARELIQLDPDMPKGLKEGLLYYQYDGHFVLCDTASGHQFWTIQTIDGSKLPSELEGNFTSRTLVHRAIDRFGSSEAKLNGALIEERKRLKREQEKANGTRDKLPKQMEDQKIIERMFLESELKNAKRERSEKEST